VFSPAKQVAKPLLASGNGGDKMPAANRSIKAIVFAVLGVALPFLVAEQLDFGRASPQIQEGLWAACLITAMASHVLLMATIAWGGRQVIDGLRGRRGSLQRTALLATSLALLGVYATSVAGLVVLW